MQESVVIQGRQITPSDIVFIQNLISHNPAWHRTQVSRTLCAMWEWKKENGQIKDMACRTLLLKLESLGHIQLPIRRKNPVNHARGKSYSITHPVYDDIQGGLKSLIPITVEPVWARSESHALFNGLLSRYHYLGFKTTVGENIKYLIRDKYQRPLACLLFGSAAWKTQPRDRFIGWSDAVRKKNVNSITNNTRFLILPWVRVPHLASHILGAVSRRIQDDWIKKYARPVYLLETFVDTERFKGTCYKAANWILVGQTQGRTRNDRYRDIQQPVKHVYVLPIAKDFRRKLLQS